MNEGVGWEVMMIRWNFDKKKIKIKIDLVYLWLVMQYLIPKSQLETIEFENDDE